MLSFDERRRSLMKDVAMETKRLGERRHRIIYYAAYAPSTNWKVKTFTRNDRRLCSREVCLFATRMTL